MNLPNPATTAELLHWLAAHTGTPVVEAHYFPRPGLRCTHYLAVADWQICDEGIDSAQRLLSFAEFQAAYPHVRWEIDAVDGDPVPNCSEPMTTAIQPGETVSIYTLQLAMAGDTRDRLENARHADEIAETLREWQYAADVALRDWRHINPPVVVTADVTAATIAEGEIFPETNVTFRPAASIFTAPAQAMARAQRTVPPLILWCKQCDTVSLAMTAPCCDERGYACPECGSDADSVRVYTVAEAQQLSAEGSSRLAARFAPVLAQLPTNDPPATDSTPESTSDYVVIFLDGGVITDWQYLSAAEAQLALVDWTDNDTEKRSGPWDHCLVYSAESDSGDREAWAFPLDYARQPAAYAEGDGKAAPAVVTLIPPELAARIAQLWGGELPATATKWRRWIISSLKTLLDRGDIEPFPEHAALLQAALYAAWQLGQLPGNAPVNPETSAAVINAVNDVPLIPADFDVMTVLALRPDWDAATAARFLADKARDLAAGREAALTELLTNELNQWEAHQG